MEEFNFRVGGTFTFSFAKIFVSHLLLLLPQAQNISELGAVGGPQ